ncbi:MAG: HEPN domain-containing protein, partial [Planctomycetota bacterium]
MTKSRDHARILLEKAAEDEWILARTVDAPDAPLAAIGFHAQQAVEKHLKAVLTSQSVDYPRTHNLALLLDLIQRQGLGCPTDAATIPRLTPFAVTFR